MSKELLIKRKAELEIELAEVSKQLLELEGAMPAISDSSYCYITDLTRYNSGWLKEVTGLDKSQSNGYSLKGSFVNAICDDNEYRVEEGALYIDCGVGGSRKNQSKAYKLFTVVSGKVVTLQHIEEGSKRWAIDLWDSIESHLNK